jgi:glycosyltransferase involved in cell wall biosynthesis
MIRLRSWQTGAVSALNDGSLVLATYRRPELVVPLLAHLTTLDDQPGEVLVVDGSPDRQTEEAVAAWAQDRVLPFRLVYIESPAGLTRQRNVGVDASHGNIVFFLDDDCRPQPGFFQAIREVFRQDRAAEVGGVGGSLINEMNRPLSRRWRLRFALGLVPRGEPGRYYPTATSVPRALALPFIGTRWTDILPGAAFACRREVLRQHRFSQFFNGYSQGEDLEMSRRIGQNWRLVWSGDARAIHEPATGGRPPSFQKGRMEVRNRYFIWRRYTPRPSVACRINLWLDFLFIGVCSLARGQVKHAAGVLSGAFECLVTPPRYNEPPAQTEYEFALEKVTTR